MADLLFSKVSRRIWGDEAFQRLSAPAPNGQTLWLRLLIGQEQNAIPGLMHMWQGSIAGSLGWSLEALQEPLGEVFREGLMKADWKVGLVWLPNGFKHNPPESPNHVRAWRKPWLEMPDSPLKLEAWEALKAYLEPYPEGYMQAYLEACPKPYPKVYRYQEQEQEQARAGGLDQDLGSGSHPPPSEPRPVTSTPPGDPAFGGVLTKAGVAAAAAELASDSGIRPVPGLRTAGQPNRMDAPGGPECGCGLPSAHESGWCGRCDNGALAVPAAQVAPGRANGGPHPSARPKPRAALGAPVAAPEGGSPEVSAIVAELGRHPALADLDHRAAAEALEGRRMATGRPIADVLAGIGDAAAEVGVQRSAGGIATSRIATILRTFTDRPQRQGSARPVQGAAGSEHWKKGTWQETDTKGVK